MMGPGNADYSYDMVKNYAVYRPGNDQRYITIRDGSSYESIINGYITKVGWNNQYIIAEESETNYWIIDVETDEVYGPFNKKEFNNQREILNVSEDIKMKDPDYYRDKNKNP